MHKDQRKCLLLSLKGSEMGNGKCEHTGGVRFLKIIGGIAIAMVAVGVLTQLNDIRRYIKISTM